MITEDSAKLAMEQWLKSQNYQQVIVRLGTAQGIDVEAFDPTTRTRLAIECKGETEAQNQWDRAWRNVSAALFNAIRATEDRSSLAFPHFPGHIR